MNNLVVGSRFRATFPVFVGKYPRARHSHDVDVVGVVTSESYGREKGQHTFTFRVLESSDPETFEVGKEYRKKGRNLYPAVWRVEQPADYEQKAAEKAARAATQSAKARKEQAEELERVLNGGGDQ
jgi:hypothetical protein